MCVLYLAVLPLERLAQLELSWTAGLPPQALDFQE